MEIVPAAWRLDFLQRTIYDPTAPANAVGALVAHIRQAIDSQRVDSPIFMAIPRLAPPPSDVLQVVPTGFTQEVQRAERSPGHLALLAREVRPFPWRLEGLRQIGAAQFNLKDWTGARQLIRSDPGIRSDRPRCERAAGDNLPAPETAGRGECGRSAPARVASRDADTSAPSSSPCTRETSRPSGSESWRTAPFEHGKQALRSPKLASSRETYLRAFKEDLNHYYSGLNALALTQVRINLAQQHPETWTDQFDNDEDAAPALVKERELAARLGGAAGDGDRK